MNSLNLNNKVLRGYISSRDLNGSYYPQNFQNLLIRTFAKENKIKLQLSGTEWIIKNSFVMLRSIIKEKNDGIIFFSLFQIYSKKSEFNNFANQILKKNKILIFVLENIIIKNSNELKKLNKILKINNILSTKKYFKNIKKIKSYLIKKSK
tara:strand:+ start:14547 stop:14999 length:453 start_codon:yes stop_codon:yes gene_type:complete